MFQTFSVSLFHFHQETVTPYHRTDSKPKHFPSRALDHYKVTQFSLRTTGAQRLKILWKEKYCWILYCYLRCPPSWLHLNLSLIRIENQVSIVTKLVRHMRGNVFSFHSCPAYCRQTLQASLGITRILPKKLAMVNMNCSKLNKKLEE